MPMELRERIAADVRLLASDSAIEQRLSAVGKAELRAGAAEHVEDLGVACRFGQRLEEGEAFTEAAAHEVGSGFGHCVCAGRERDRE